VRSATRSLPTGSWSARTKAREVGLPAAVEQDTELKQILTAAEQPTTQPDTQPATVAPEPKHYVQDLGPFVPQNKLTRSTTFLQAPTNAINNIPDVVPEIFDLADQPVDEGQAHRAGAFPIANQFRWLVAELTEVKPLYAGSFDKYLKSQVASGRLQGQSGESFARLWANAENVKERTGFVPEGSAQPAGGLPSEGP
jgi:hypothetical protein